MRRLRPHLSYANVMASIAVFIALGGSSYAAVQLSKGQVKAKHIAKNAVTSAKVKNGSLKAKDFKPGQLPAGPQGAQGPQGPTGPQGAQGAAGPFPDGDMPSGKTLRGAYSLAELQTPTNTSADSISFGFTLASSPTVHLVVAGATPPAECPGTVANPAAAAGHLCIYELVGTAAGVNRVVVNPTTGAQGEASRFGAALVWIGTGATDVYSRGTWAVTAP